VRRNTMSRLAVIAVAGCATFSVTLLPAPMAGAATDTVTTCAGSGPGSLPAVVASAASGDTVSFSVTCSPGDPIVVADTIDINENLTINGPGPSTLAVSGNNAVEVFEISSAVTGTISGITIEDGSTATGDGGPGGGGIDNDGTLTVTNSTVSGNAAGGLLGGNGGGIENKGTLTVDDSTVSGNTAIGHGHTGGGINNDGVLTVSDSTIADNQSVGGGDIQNDVGATAEITSSTLTGGSAPPGDGGDIDNAGTATLAATIVAGNQSEGGDCGGTITDAGDNLDDDGSCGFTGTSLSHVAAGLDAMGLQYNGGPTQTVALQAGSAAVAAVDSRSLCAAPDQRGVPRPTPCDIGAVELVIPRGITSADSATATAGSVFSFTVTTSGVPVTSLAEKGAVPRHTAFVNNGDGTATISGTPRKVETYDLTIKATFGTGRTKYVVMQAFTLTVNAG
jgi:hypothetical protein